MLLLALRAPFDIASTVISATFLQNAFDSINQNDAARLTATCLIFGLASLCLFLYNGTIWYIYAPFAARMEGTLRVKLYEKMSSFSVERIEATSHGDWLTRLNTDVEMPFSRAVHLPHAACAVVNISISAIILCRINGAVFGWVMLYVIPPIIINQLLIARVMPRLTQQSVEATATNTDALTPFITCAEVTAIYDGQDFLLKRFEKSSLALRHANMKIRAKSALGAGIWPLFGLSGYLILLIVSSGGIADNAFTFGDLTAAFQYRNGLWVGSVMLNNCLISIQASRVGIRRINEMMAEKTEE